MQVLTKKKELKEVDVIVDPKISDSYWNELERTLERQKIQDYQIKRSKIILNPYVGFIKNN